MTPEQIEEAAMALFSAEITGRQMGLLSRRFPDMTIADAYAVQRALVARKQETGRKITGWKIGLTSRAMQIGLTSRAMQDALKIDTLG